MMRAGGQLAELEKAVNSLIGSRSLTWESRLQSGELQRITQKDHAVTGLLLGIATLSIALGTIRLLDEDRWLVVALMAPLGGLIVVGTALLPSLYASRGARKASEFAGDWGGRIDTREGAHPISASVSPPFDALESAHHDLMASYVATANDATRLPVLFLTKRWCERNRASLGKPPWLALGFAARLFVESHLKRKVKEITDAYVQLESALSIVGDSEYRAWLREARDSLAGFRGSLSSSHRLRLTLGALWPALTGVLGIVGLQLSLPGSIDPTVLWLIALVVLVDLGPYLYMFLRSSFLVKRDLFLPGARMLEKEPHEAQRKLGGHVYQFEDELFELLGRAKKKEMPVDAAGLFAILLVPAALVVVGLARLLHLGDSVWTFLIASFILTAVVTRPAMILRQREWQ